MWKMICTFIFTSCTDSLFADMTRTLHKGHGSLL